MDTVIAGRMGGRKLVHLKGKDYFKEISKKGVEARKKKKDAKAQTQIAS